MFGKMSRRHLFARLGACLAGLWPCHRTTAPAATNHAASAVPCGAPPPLFTTYRYDGDGTLLEVLPGPGSASFDAGPWTSYVCDGATKRLVQIRDLDAPGHSPT